MRLKTILTKIHFISGIVLTAFIGLHFFNHFFSIIGPEKHIEIMKLLRPIYRNTISESLLFLAVLLQLCTGSKLRKANQNTQSTPFELIQHWSGIYLAYFLLIHVAAVLIGRYFLKLDTNFYFGAAGLNSFPANLFFIPYYCLGILSFFAHLAAIHNKKMKVHLVGLSPTHQAKIILFFGMVVTLLLLCGFTNQFNGLDLPDAYAIFN